MSDHLAQLPEAQVAAWYRRLADSIGRQKVGGSEPLASTFLRAWLDNRVADKQIRFAPPAHLKQSAYVFAVQQYHRAVFLTEQRARIGKRTVWAGVVPRLQDGRWSPGSTLDMSYESLVEVGSGLADLIRIQRSGTEGERDLLTSLRGFQLKSEVRLTGTATAAGKVAIRFTSWKCSANDRYDWNYSEHFTVPNPDFQSRQVGAVRPEDQTLRVYHRNAQRLEKAGLAAPFKVLITSWVVADNRITGPAEVDPSRRL